MDKFDPVIKDKYLYSDAVNELLKRAAKPHASSHNFGKRNFINVHIDRERGDVVVGIFNQRGRFKLGFSTLEL